jgi:hypothetical protein
LLFRRPRAIIEAAKEYQMTYQGVTYSHEKDQESDGTVKVLHEAIMPENTTHTIDFTPYKVMSRIDFQNWVDAGFPSRSGLGPLDSEDLAKLAEAKR